MKLQRSAYVAAVALGLCLLLPRTCVAASTFYFRVSMHSTRLSAYLGKPVDVQASLLLPRSYYRQPQRRYPVLYWIQGFGGEGYLCARCPEDETMTGANPKPSQEFIIVLLDGMFDGGHQEFADSPNNGPWGTTLISDFIPQTESQFRTNGVRFVAGHSSGGWSAMWLQIMYPDTFSGEWSVSPDPLDFRDFAGPDLTRSPPQNFFKDASGRDYFIDGQKLRDFVRGAVWEKRQYQSFESVFSPRGVDGKPEQLFDRATGTIDPLVQQYWDANWDIAALFERHWTNLAPKLQHKLHVIVGTKDTFGLDRSVRLFQSDMQRLGSDAEFDYVPGADHWTVFYFDGNLFSDMLSEAAALMDASSAR